jgi:nitrogen fixation protein FixH
MSWPVGLVAVLVLFVSVQVTLVTIAAHAFEGPDDPEYYNEGLHYNDEIAARRDQARLGWTVHANLQPGTVEVTVAQSGRPLSGARVDVALGRPATRLADCTLHLQEIGHGHYRQPCHLAPGAWVMTIDVQRQCANARYVVRQSL